METPTKYKVLIIDDEPQIRRLLMMTLDMNNYKSFEAENGKNGLLSVSMNRPDVVLLDLGLPDMSGIAALKKLREWSSVPVIILTVFNEEEKMVEALDSGADDYVTKPFNTGELMARIRVAIRHSLKLEETTLFTSGALTVDLVARTVKINNNDIKLTATEYSLLALFIKYSGRVLTHTQISREIWANPYADNSQILRVHIAQLRKKIEKNPSIPELLITEPAVGYRLKVL
jgi:two-component system KDP operon response regulator KdpE